MALDDGKKVIAISGPSGVGKSSLLHAGILGHLQLGTRSEVGRNWQYLEAEPKPGGEGFLNSLAFGFSTLLKRKLGRVGDRTTLKKHCIYFLLIRLKVRRLIWMRRRHSSIDVSLILFLKSQIKKMTIAD